MIRFMIAFSFTDDKGGLQNPDEVMLYVLFGSTAMCLKTQK